MPQRMVSVIVKIPVRVFAKIEYSPDKVEDFKIIKYREVLRDAHVDLEALLTENIDTPPTRQKILDILRNV